MNKANREANQLSDEHLVKLQDEVIRNIELITNQADLRQELANIKARRSEIAVDKMQLEIERKKHIIELQSVIRRELRSLNNRRRLIQADSKRIQAKLQGARRRSSPQSSFIRTKRPDNT